MLCQHHLLEHHTRRPDMLAQRGGACAPYKIAHTSSAVACEDQKAGQSSAAADDAEVRMLGHSGAWVQRLHCNSSQEATDERNPYRENLIASKTKSLSRFPEASSHHLLTKLWSPEMRLTHLQPSTDPSAWLTG